MGRKTVDPAVRLARTALLATALAAGPAGRTPGAPCGSLDELRARLAATPSAEGRADAAATFATCAENAGTPLLFPSRDAARVRALFVFRSAAPRVFLAGDLNGWSTTSHPLEKLAGTDLHVLAVDVVDGARLDYKLVVGGTEWTLDPWNPRTMPGGFGPNSELRTTSYRPPADVEPKPGSRPDRFEQLTVESRALGGTRRVVAWVPPGLEAGKGPVPALYLLDGLDYREFGRVHVVAANLVSEGRLPPLLLVLVPPVDRGTEYERREAFERFLAGELVPAVEARWSVRRDPAGRGVMGASLGAFAALSATARTGLFGRCGAQSTGNAVPANLDALLADLARLPAGAARFHVDVGTFESDLHGSDLLAVSRRLRPVLARRQALEYLEVPEGHSWGSWRARLAEALTFFWGDSIPAAEGAPRPLDSPLEGAARFSGGPASLDVKDADLVEVVRTLTADRGLSVVWPPGFAGTVTATLRDVAWDEALHLVLAANGWDYVREGRVVRIVRHDAPGP